jgi:hypothetical protein
MVMIFHKSDIALSQRKSEAVNLVVSLAPVCRFGEFDISHRPQ